MANRAGLDLGTKNIVLSTKDNDKIKHIRELNCFLPFQRMDQFTEKMLVQSGVPYVRRGDEFIAIGEKAEYLAYSFNKVVRRPMAEGVLSRSEGDAVEIMAIIVRSILKDRVDEGSIIYYCVPGNPVNANFDTKFHKKIAELIMSGTKHKAYPINEARALIIGATSDNTAIGCSLGSGMINVSYCVFGVPVFEFSLVGAGDKIDLESAKRFGYDPSIPSGDYKQTPTSVCRYKEKMSLESMPEDNLGRTIYINYGIMIEEIVDGIVNGFKKNEDKARIDRPIKMVLGGGTSMPKGVVTLFKQKLAAVDVPFEIGEIIHAKDPLHAVADGCLKAAELHEE